MILVVTGGRDFADRTRLHAALDALHAGEPLDHLVLGDASGADTLAYDWVRHRHSMSFPMGCGIRCTRHFANWRDFGKAAGPERNGRMIAQAVSLASSGAKAIVLACPGGRGTADCVAKARAANLTVKTLDEVLSEKP